MEKINCLLKAMHKQYYLLFLAVAIRKVGCQTTAKDVVQEAYINAIESLKACKYENLDDEDNLKKFIITCIYRRAFDWNRTQSTRRESPIDCGSDLENLLNKNNELSICPNEDRLKEILDLANLSSTERVVLNELLEGKKISEIAKTLKVSPRKMTNSKFYILNKLRKIVPKIVGQEK